MIFAVYNDGSRVSRWHDASSCWLKRRLSRMMLGRLLPSQLNRQQGMDVARAYGLAPACVRQCTPGQISALRPFVPQ